MVINKNTNGFADNIGRNKKAKKIQTIISKAYKSSIDFEKTKLLDVGTGNGEIASYLGQYCDVISIDICDQRQISSSYRFEKVTGELIPLQDKSIDIIISNHVIEHVRDAEQHLSEMNRVLKDNGIIYLASPNRLWPFEVHYKIYFLHYLPYAWFHFILKIFKKYREDVKLLSWWQIKKMVKNKFIIKEYSSQITKNLVDYEMNLSPSILKIINVVPLWLIQKFMFINPTIVVLLRKKLE